MGLGENYLKRLNCEHENNRCISNYYGKTIEDNKSTWRCEDCGKVSYQPYINEDCHFTNFIF